MLAIAALVLAGSAAGAPPGSPDRVEIVSATEVLPVVTCDTHTGPDAALRLRVYRGGRCVLERGLVAGVEQATLAPDGTVAAIGTTRIAAEGAPPASAVTWIDPWHPGGKWELKLERGRAVRLVEPLPRHRGIAISSSRDPYLEADFRLVGADGLTVMRIREDEGSTLAIRVTDSARFLALDIAYPDHPPLPERAVLVLDLERKTRWAYRWSYGSDDEPTAWSLSDDGTLEVSTARGTIRRFDSLGGEIR